MACEYYLSFIISSDIDGTGTWLSRDFAFQTPISLSFFCSFSCIYCGKFMNENKGKKCVNVVILRFRAARCFFVTAVNCHLENVIKCGIPLRFELVLPINAILYGKITFFLESIYLIYF